MNWRFWEEPPKKLEEEPLATFLFAKGPNPFGILSIERCRHAHTKEFVTEVTFFEEKGRYSHQNIVYHITHNQHEIFTEALAKEIDAIAAK